MFIIFRYLTRQILVSMLAVTGVLLMVFMSGRFIKYLAQAAEGSISPDVLFAIMGYRLPDFLELILPLGLFIGILLAYGRMYLESEMVVLYACGVSERQIIMQTMGASLLVTLIVGACTIYLSPWGLQQVDNILKEQSQTTEFAMLVPGRFQKLKEGNRVAYSESLSGDKREMHNVFIAQHDKANQPLILISAETGNQYVDPKTGSRYLVLHNGARFEGNPGKLDYKVTTFDSYGMRLAKPTNSSFSGYADAVSTEKLWGSSDPKMQAMLQWRLALPFIVPVVTLLAIRLSRVNPRQGRFFHLLPAMLIYITYLGSMIAGQSALAKGRLPLWAGLWWIHILFLLLIAGLYWLPAWRRKRGARHAAA
ncbi:LPS export ABC transporter permease LptF [Mangrovitalea sediminis]|uniref:LPS export ABC transporter permease LptF n=1 Tax=Mangrovitalea sediminis TaxID=1982043 RepID=UPI000BE5AA90|nr:LPS export ABC transporter permease LptF [Mangrovitalea sediminis]